MVETEELDIRVSRPTPWRFGWLLPLFYRPARTMRQVAAQERPTWLLPLLLLTVFTLVHVMVGGPLRQEAARNAAVQLPENFQYMSPEQQQQYMQALESRANPTMAYVFPAIGALAGLWVSWFLLGGVLHLALTLLGSRGTSTEAFNIVAWASLPFLIRLVVQIVSMFAARQLVVQPGLAGFIPADAAGGLAYVKGILAMVDLYLVWQVVLLILAAASMQGLTRMKAIFGVLGVVALLLALGALPGFLSGQLSGMNVDRPFFLF
jgi:hypothetical protein